MAKTANVSTKLDKPRRKRPGFIRKRNHQILKTLRITQKNIQDKVGK